MIMMGFDVIGSARYQPGMRSASSRFYAGDYQGALKLLAKQPRTSSTASLEIGALVFTGDIAEAEGLFRKSFENRPGSGGKSRITDGEAEARFFLGIGFVRSARNSRGASLFAENLARTFRSGGGEARAIARFYAWQGAAFFRFFQARFEHSSRLAEQALVAASEARFHYGKILALDLLGHSFCQRGQVSRSLLHFEKAEKLAATVGNGGILTAIRISKLRFRCQFGLSLQTAERDLERALRELEPTDTYSQAELKLELARQWVLRGRNHRARRLLEEFGEEVHRHRNSQQSAVYQLRVAHTLFLMGQQSAALTLARSARAALDSRVDRMYIAQLEGLENKIQGALAGQRGERAAVNHLDGRIRSRPTLQQKSTEDVIGDWMDRVVHEGEGALLGLVKSGLHGLIPLALRISASESALIPGPIKGMVILSCEGDVRVIHEGWSPSLTKLIRALSSGEFRSKEKLVQLAWGYQKYHPERHDGLLHGSLSRMRSLLGEFSSWIEGSESGYRLKPEVRVMEGTAGAKRAPLPVFQRPEPIREAAPGPDSTWNIRQYQALQLMRQGSFLGVTEYSRRFKVSKITASRDLGGLHASGAVRKLGRARATHYGLI
jgi:hypothetical protein